MIPYQEFHYDILPVAFSDVHGILLSSLDSLSEAPFTLSSLTGPLGPVSDPLFFP